MPGKTSGPNAGLGRRGLFEPAKNNRLMSASDPAANAGSPGGWLANQPYVLLCITALCWAGNAIVGRLAAGHIPPVTLSFIRWDSPFSLFFRSHGNTSNATGARSAPDSVP